MSERKFVTACAFSLLLAACSADRPAPTPTPRTVSSETPLTPIPTLPPIDKIPFANRVYKAPEKMDDKTRETFYKRLKDITVVGHCYLGSNFWDERDPSLLSYTPKKEGRSNWEFMLTNMEDNRSHVWERRTFVNTQHAEGLLSEANFVFLFNPGRILDLIRQQTFERNPSRQLTAEDLESFIRQSELLENPPIHWIKNDNKIESELGTCHDIYGARFSAEREGIAFLKVKPTANLAKTS